MRILIVLIFLTYACTGKTSESRTSNSVPETKPTTSGAYPKRSEAIKSISIIEYSDPEDIIITMVASDSITKGPIEESTGEFYKVYQSNRVDKLLDTLIQTLKPLYNSAEDYFSNECNKDDITIGLSFDKGSMGLRNITFTNYYDSIFKAAVTQVNSELNDSLKIKYDKSIEKCM